MLEPEVKASIVYAAHDMAAFIMKQEKPGNSQKAYEVYLKMFEKLYGSIAGTVSSGGQ